MTATAAAPAFGPIVASALRAQPQAANDRFAFAAVLDSLPGAEAKAGSSVDGDQSPTSNEPKQGGASPGQPDFQSILSSLPFAFLPASAPHEGAAAGEASPPAPASTLGLRPEDDGASNIAGADPANPAAVGRLVGERAFHLSLPTVGPPTFAPTAASSQGGGAPIGSSSLAPLSMQGQGLVGEGAPSAVGVASALAPSWSETSAFAPTAASRQGGGAPIPSSLAPLSMQGQGLVGEGAPSAVGAASAIASVGASRIGERVLLASLPSARRATAAPLGRPRRPGARHRRPRRLLPSSMDRRQTHPPASPDRRRKVPPTAAGNPKSQRRHRSPGLRVRLPPPLRSRAARPPTVRPIRPRPACSRRPPEARSAQRRRRLSLRGRRSDLLTRQREPRTSRHARARFPLPEQPRLRPSRRSMSIFRLAAWRTPP